MSLSALDYAEEEAILIRFLGHTFEPLPSGGLYWRAERTLLVADLHLEKMSSFAARGQLLPPYDTGLTLARLAADVASTGAEHVVSLGDSFHRDEGTVTLLDLDRARLDGIMERVRWTWIAGNHDPSPHRLGGHCVSSFEIGGVTLTHEPRRGANGLMAGHLHPAARVEMNGRTVRRPCFVHDGRIMLLPAYGASAGSINILSAAFHGLFSYPSLQVTMLGRGRIYPVSPRRLVAG